MIHTLPHRGRCFVLGLFVLWMALPSGCGAVTFSTLFSFKGTNGAQPYGRLTLGPDGSFYGTTSAGGAAGAGTVFKLTTSGAFMNLASFDGTNGSQPLAGLALGLDGNFYGTTSTGGTNGNGTVFLVTTAGDLTSFPLLDSSSNGAQPVAGLLLDTNTGNFFGTTSAGGANDDGTVFMVTPTGAFSTLFSFDGTNGAQPAAELVAVLNGGFYGTTSGGGANGYGTVFRISPGNPPSFTSLYSFTGTSDGAGPRSGLTQAGDGTFYGTTAGGGTNGAGTIFNIGTATNLGALQTLHTFSGPDGANPFGTLLLASDGSLYGTTMAGGAHGSGTVFNLSTNGTLTNLYSFTGGAGGANPRAGLAVGTNGNVYGVTSGGGKGGNGTVFQVSGFLPFIIEQPVGQIISTGAVTGFHVSAGGSAPLSYQWQLNAINLTESRRVSGTRTADLTISNATVADAGTYSVLVSNPEGSVTSTGAVLVVNVGPGIRIDSPRQNTIVEQELITMTGRATGSVAIAFVYFRLNDSDWNLATTSDGWNHWKANLTLELGPNVAEAYAVNVVGGQTTTQSVNFVYGLTRSALTVQTNGNGSVSPNNDGKLLDVGRGYTMTAKPGKDFLFSNWTDGGDVVITNTARLDFVMESNLVLQANFVPNPFIDVSGMYNGLFSEAGGVLEESSGFITITVSDKGKFSGHVQMGAARSSLSGQFDLDGNSEVIIVRQKLGSLTADLHLDLTDGTDQITGTISNATWTANAVADRAVFDGKTRIAPQQGRYTMTISGGNDPTIEPGGDGYGTLSINKAGRIQFSGTLADGTKVTQSVPISKNGLWPLYAGIYAGQGSISGGITFDSTAMQDLAGTVTWIRPSQPGAKYFPGGFMLTTSATGSAYAAPPKGTSILTLTDADVVLIGGNLSQSITNQITLDGNNHVTDQSGNQLKLTFSVSAGTFSGSLIDPDTSKRVAFNGVALQKQNMGDGFFLGTNQSGQVLLLGR